MAKVKTLTRSDIADAITAEFQVTKFEALDFIHEVLSEISDALVEGEDVKLTGFGTFKVRNVWGGIRKRRSQLLFRQEGQFLLELLLF